jgi:hypothetical protein
VAGKGNVHAHPDLRQFRFGQDHVRAGARDRWVIEGCYGELVERAAAAATELVFLNPGVEACLANNRRRPWEPAKYRSSREQDVMLDQLQAWVADYVVRNGPWSCRAHRRIFDRYGGVKRAVTDPAAHLNISGHQI